MDTEIYDLGKIGITLGNEWDADVNYEKLTFVFYKGDGYISVVNNKSVKPTDNTKVWFKAVEHGFSSYEQMVASGKFIGTEEEYLQMLTDAVNASPVVKQELVKLNVAINDANTIINVLKNKVEEVNIISNKANDALNKAETVVDKIETAEQAATNAAESALAAQGSAAQAETHLDTIQKQINKMTTPEGVIIPENVVAQVGDNKAAIAEHEEKLSELDDKEMSFNYSLDNPFIMVDGSELTNEGISRTYRLNVKEGNRFNYTLANFSNGYIITAFDSNGVVLKDNSIIGSGVVVSEIYIVPSGVSYLQACNRDSLNNDKHLILQGLKEDLFDVRKEVEDTVKDVSFGFNENPDNPFVTVDGSVLTLNGFQRTYKIQVEQGQIYKYKISNHPNAFTIAAFDKDGVVIKDKSIIGTSRTEEGTYIVEKGVYYLQACNRTDISSDKSLYLLGFKNAVKEIYNIVDNNSKSVLYVSPEGNDNNDGSFSKPFKTINKALISATLSGTTIVLDSGDYRETIKLNNITTNNVKIQAKSETAKVRLIGSRQVDINTTHIENIYKADVPPMPLVSYDFYKAYILGIDSLPVNLDESFPQMCGAKYRLPYLRFTHFPSIFANVLNTEQAIDILKSNVNAGYMYYDKQNNVVYISSSNNLANKKLEIYDKPLFEKNNNNNGRSIDLMFENIDFYFSNNLRTESEYGINSFSWNHCKFYSFSFSNVPYFGAFNKYDFCESADAGMDGFASQMDADESKPYDLDKALYTIYNNCWAHDCYDDGYSHHNRGRVVHNSCLSSYNIVGDGFVYANGSQAEFYNCIAIKNGGHGFSAVAGVNDGRINTSMLCVNCISDSNKSGYELQDAINMDLTMKLYNCISRNNEIGYHIKGNAKASIIFCNNCTTDSDAVSKKIDSISQNTKIIINNGVLLE